MVAFGVCTDGASARGSAIITLIYFSTTTAASHTRLMAPMTGVAYQARPGRSRRTADLEPVSAAPRPVPTDRPTDTSESGGMEGSPAAVSIWWRSRDGQTTAVRIHRDRTLQMKIFYSPSMVENNNDTMKVINYEKEMYISLSTLLNINLTNDLTYCSLDYYSIYSLPGIRLCRLFKVYFNIFKQ